MRSFPTIYARIRQAEQFGVKLLPGGTRFLGHVPHIGPKAWFHRVYPPTLDWQLQYIERELDRQIPEPLADFYALANGINLFSGALSVDGYRGDYERGEDDPWPFDIIQSNLSCFGGSGAPNGLFLIGGYTWNNGCYIFLRSDGTVIVSPQFRFSPIKTWHSLDAWFLSEVERIAPLFDSLGHKKDSTTPTSPVG